MYAELRELCLNCTVSFLSLWNRLSHWSETHQVGGWPVDLRDPTVSTALAPGYKYSRGTHIFMWALGIKLMYSGLWDKHFINEAVPQPHSFNQIFIIISSGLAKELGIILTGKKSTIFPKLKMHDHQSPHPQFYSYNLNQLRIKTIQERITSGLNMCSYLFILIL